MSIWPCAHSIPLLWRWKQRQKKTEQKQKMHACMHTEKKNNKQQKQQKSVNNGEKKINLHRHGRSETQRRRFSSFSSLFTRNRACSVGQLFNQLPWRVFLLETTQQNETTRNMSTEWRFHSISFFSSSSSSSFSFPFSAVLLLLFGFSFYIFVCSCCLDYWKVELGLENENSPDPFWPHSADKLKKAALKKKLKNVEKRGENVGKVKYGNKLRHKLYLNNKKKKSVRLCHFNIGFVRSLRFEWENFASSWIQTEFLMVETPFSSIDSKQKKNEIKKRKDGQIFLVQFELDFLNEANWVGRWLNVNELINYFRSWTFRLFRGDVAGRALNVN